LIFVLTISFLTLFWNFQFLQSSWAKYNNLGKKVTISVSGTAEREVLVDESRISLVVENTNTDANTARKNDAHKMNSIVNI